MALIGYCIVLLISFYLLAQVCDRYFIESLDKISARLKISSDAAGATLMAAGSSAPELFIVIISILKSGNHQAIGIGTIVGSAIFNILIIIGAVAVVKKTVLKWQPMLRDFIFYALSIFLLIIILKDGHITLIEAASFIILYLVYFVAVVKWRKILPYKDETKIIKKNLKNTNKNKCKNIFRPLDFVLSKLFPSLKYYYLVFFISLAVIAILSWLLVESAIGISHILHIPEAIIALTVLAAGTSVPDMISSVIVAKQGRGNMAVSNAIGSNIFDILLGLGIPWLIVLSFSNNNMLAVSTEDLLISIKLLFATFLIVFILLTVRKWRIGYWEGAFLICLYIMYIIWEVVRL